MNSREGVIFTTTSLHDTTLVHMCVRFTCPGRDSESQEHGLRREKKSCEHPGRPSPLPSIPAPRPRFPRCPAASGPGAPRSPEPLPALPVPQPRAPELRWRSGVSKGEGPLLPGHVCGAPSDTAERLRVLLRVSFPDENSGEAGAELLAKSPSKAGGRPRTCPEATEVRTRGRLSAAGGEAPPAQPSVGTVTRVTPGFPCSDVPGACSPPARPLSY